MINRKYLKFSMSKDGLVLKYFTFFELFRDLFFTFIEILTLKLLYVDK